MKIAPLCWLALGAASVQVVGVLGFSQSSLAADQTATAPSTATTPDPNSSPNGGERLNVDTLKRNYWNRTDDGSPRVVQNRLYSKAHKLELGVFGSLVSDDPFLSVKSLGLSLGFHFTEEWGFDLQYWRLFSSPSSAEGFLEANTQATANTNDLRAYTGGEIAFSPIYGKLALLNNIIIHYDFHILAGGGVVNTETGNDVAFSWGLGQQVYLTKNISLRLDYRNLRFSESLLSKDKLASNYGQIISSRSNSTDVITAGFTFLFGFASEK